jgi:hypothetical protein
VPPAGRSRFAKRGILREPGPFFKDGYRVRPRIPLCYK